jgi:hypothetical protein
MNRDTKCVCGALGMIGLTVAAVGQHASYCPLRQQGEPSLFCYVPPPELAHGNHSDHNRAPAMPTWTVVASTSASTSAMSGIWFKINF